jgi:transcriptional regulator with XRE-family HTH domain
VRSPLAIAIRQARLTVRLTQQQVGTRMGLKGRAVYRWERGDSLPRRRIRADLIRVIQMFSVDAANRLQAAFAAHDALVKGHVPAPPPPPPPPAKPSGPVALELAIFAMADELDLAPRRLRSALTRLFARVSEAGYSLDSARREVEARIAAQSDGSRADVA